MNKKISLVALSLFGSVAISLTTVGLSKSQRLFASDDYSRTFTFDKNTKLNSTYDSASDTYEVKGDYYVSSSLKHFISYELG